MQANFDLHTHTTISDGSFTPSELVQKAIREGLKVIAISDHDNINGIEKAKKVAENSGLKVIAGVELSVEYSPGTMHICGYFIDVKNDYLNKQLEFLQEARRTRNPKIVEKLQQSGFKITMEEVEKKSGGKQVGRPHFATILYEKAYVTTKQEAFDKYLDKSASCYVNKTRLTLEESIKCIREAGGVPILAHPIELKLENKDEYRKMFQALKEKGILGVEAFTSRHLIEQNQFFFELAKEMDFLVTGGSDFHGTNKPDVELGMFGWNLDKKINEIINEMLCFSGSFEM